MGMMRMKIGDGAVTDISTLGFELIKSPESYGSTIKDSNIIVTDFPEEHGSRVYIPAEPKKATFDYTIKLGYYSESGDAAAKINAFIESLIGKDVVIYNDYKKVQLTGKYKSYKDDGTYEGTKVALFDVTFLINNPDEIVYT
jgi:hypothetical protein